MDWNTFLTSVAGSTVVAAAIGYVLKKSFDRALDLHFEKLKEHHKASIQEDVRRQAFIYDKQFTVLRVALSLVYRLRNTIRYVMDQAQKRHALNQGDLFRQFENDNMALIELLFDERAILPSNIFKIAHDLKNPLAQTFALIAYMGFKNQANGNISDDKVEEGYEDLIEAYHRIDDGYSSLVHEVHQILGIHPTDDT